MPTLKRDREAMDDEGARKKIKTSPVDDIHTIHPIMDLTGDEPQTKPGAEMPPSQELQTLQTLRGDFDDIRQLVTCKICERLLYEPYVISCGHTYCYSCLCTWFGTTKKKTCPNCREVITQPPAPSYVIREMINIFLRSHNLLPDGEAIEQHQQWAFEEAELVRNDKNNGDPKTGGLFKGIFRPRRARLLPNHDPVDHVDRCPRCNWEIEDGMCMQCGIHMDSWSDDSDISTSDLSNSLHAESIEDNFEDDDMDADPDFGEYDIEFDPEAYNAWLDQQGIMDYSDHSPTGSRGAAERADMLRQMVRERGRTSASNAFRRAMRDPRLMDEEAEDDEMGHEIDEEDEDEEDDEDEDAGSIDDFLDDRDINDITTHTISSQTEEPTPARRHRNRHRHHQHSEAEESVSNSESESNSDSDGIRHNPHFHRLQVPVYTIPSDDDEEPVTQPTRRRPIRVVDSDEESPSGSETASEDEAPRSLSTRTHHSTSRRSNPPVLVSRRQTRPIRVLDSEDENDEEISNSSGDSDEGDEDEDLHYQNYSDDIEAAHEGEAEEAGFSPIQDSASEDEGDQNAVNYFNVYGDDEDQGSEDGINEGEEEEDDYY
ncbi:hypothetical protein QM012_007750 [Aureobasidium pullulans]|uniref:RING-type domain-containing protein n=1 Tax=Aureobasidium pullulans TaxID=5580 RepID=A0ABR0TM46_AURPU